MVAIENEIGHANTGMVPWSSIFDTIETNPKLAWPNSIAVYAEMLKDTQVRGLMRAVTLPIQGYKWFIKPNDAPDERVAFVAENFNLPIEGLDEGNQRRTRGRFSHSRHLRHALLSLSYGNSYMEQLYRIDGSPGQERAHLHKLAPRLPGSINEIGVASDGGLEYIRQYPSGVVGTGVGNIWGGLQSKPIKVDRLVAYVNEQEGGNWYGTSMLRSCYKHWALNDRLMRVDGIKHERNGMGVPIVEAPPGASKAQIDQASALAQQYKAGEMSGGALPDGFRLRLVGTEGSVPDTIPSLRYHDEQMAQSFLEMFMKLGTTQTGSRSLGESMIDFFALSQEAIAKEYVDTTNAHVIEDLIDQNWLDDEPVPVLAFAPRDEELAFSDLSILVRDNIVTVDPEIEKFVRAKANLPRLEEPVDNTAVPPVKEATITALPVAASGRSPRVVHAASGHREPSDIEIQAGVDFDLMKATFDDALEALVPEWVAQVKTAQVSELANLIAATPADDLAALAALQATPVGQDLLSAAMKDMATKAVAQATAELVSQGAEMDILDLTALTSSLETRAGALAIVMARSISEAAARAALPLAGGSLSSYDIANQVAERLDGLTDAYPRKQLGGALIQAQNSARREVFDEGPASTIYASELQDTTVCKPCSDIDEEKYASTTAAEADYPAGSYRNCLGDTSCRGTLIAVLDSEAEPSVQ